MPLSIPIVLGCYYLISISLAELFYPQAIKVNDGDTLKIKTTFLETQIYDNSDGSLMVEMTGRAYCINEICSIPGPTLIVYPDTTFQIDFENAFESTATDLTSTEGADLSNLHTHGLHISGDEDNVFETVHPTESISFDYTIHPQHHLGTNWYHAHKHGSTALQVMQGMYGALIVDSVENQDLDYSNPLEIKDYVIQISATYLHDAEDCSDCDYVTSRDGKNSFSYNSGFKKIGSLCSTWCNYEEDDREESGYDYDVQLYGDSNIFDDDPPSFEAFLVNNQYQPMISDLETNQYYKFRIISASASLFMQLQFDYNETTNCEYTLIARDGIALQDIQRDLSKNPYYGFFLLPPGGRIDVLVLCENAGNVSVKHNELHPNYSNIEVAYPMGRFAEQILFTLSFDEQEEEDITAEVEIDEHLLYPEPFNDGGYPYYLNELIESTSSPLWNSSCPCSRFDHDEAEDPFVQNRENFCGFEFIEGDGDKFEVNGVVFDSDDPQALFIISKDEIYRFYVNADGHPFHIHVNPFMVEDDLLNGYIAQKWDMMDTLGYNNIKDTNSNENGGTNDSFMIRYNTRDFATNVVLHCHFLGHEDMGMMGFMKIVDGSTNNESYCEANYGFGLEVDKTDDDEEVADEDEGIVFVKEGKKGNETDMLGLDMVGENVVIVVLSVATVFTAISNVCFCLKNSTQRKIITVY